MHSLRAAYVAIEDETPPFSVGDLARTLSVTNDIALRAVLGRLTFPENDVELFKTYDVSSEALDAVTNELQAKKISLPDTAKNAEARRLQDDRVALRASLVALSPFADRVREETSRIRDLILRRQAGEAEVVIDTMIPSSNPIPIFAALDPSWTNALRTDDVEGLRLGPGGVPEKVVLRGYGGPPVDEPARRQIVELARFLRANSGERRFTIGLLKAESLVGQRRFDEALAAYDEVLTSGNRAERKLVALRKAAAQNAAADQLFDGLAPGDAVERQRIRERYRAVASIVADHKVSTENPRALAIVLYAELKLVLVDSGFTALGSPSVVRPAVGRTALEQLADVRTRFEQAGRALAAFHGFVNALEKELDDEVKVAMDLNAAEASLDQLAIEQGILVVRREQLTQQKNRNAALLGIQIATSIGQLIATVAGGQGDSSGPGTEGQSNGNSTGGGQTSQVNGLTRLVELGFERKLLGLDGDILDLEELALQSRERQARQQKTLLGILAASGQVRRDRFLDLANAFEAFTLEAMRGTMRTAWQAAEQLAFEKGTARPLVTIDTSILSATDDVALALLPTRFEQTLNALSDAINNPTSGKDPLSHQLSLLHHDPLALARFQQTGETDFVVSLYDVDRLFPGSPNVRIVKIEIQPFDKTPAQGLTVTLAHAGVFIVRDAATLLDAKQLQPSDATLEQASLAFREGRMFTSEGVTFLNAGEERKRIRFGPGSPQPETTREGLDGYGLTGGWNLKINENELDTIDLASIRNVFITFHVEADLVDTGFEEHINGLIRAFEGQQSDVRDTVTFFSMRDKFPSQLDVLIDEKPADGVELDIADIFEGEGVSTHLKALVLQVLTQESVGIPGIGLRAVPEAAETSFELETQAGGFTADLSGDIPVIPPEQRFPVGATWRLSVLTPDTSGIHDIRWFIVHEERRREQ